MNDISDSFLITKKFKSATEFSTFIEQFVIEHRLDYMDGLIHYCEKAGLDIESIGSLITKSLKEKIREEATQKNFFKRTGQLEL